MMFPKICSSRRPFLSVFSLCVLSVCVVLLSKYARVPLFGRSVQTVELSKLRALTTTQKLPVPSPDETRSQLRVSSSSENVTKFRVTAPGENIQVDDLQVHITTAAHYHKNPANKGYDLYLNGWARHNDTKKFKCCLLRKLPSSEILEDGGFIEVNAKLYHMHVQFIVDMQNAEFLCALSAKQLSAIGDANFSHVAFAKESCRQASPVAMEILQPKPVSNSVCVCLKITYGSLDPTRMVEWFEFTRLMGVTKVFTYYFDVDLTVYKVLDYYRSIGYLDLLLIHPAKSKDGPERGFRRPRYEQQAWMDEVMAANDCKHRMAGFDYVIVKDIDELIVPQGNLTTYYDILSQAEKAQPKAVCFPFDAQVVLPEWGVSRDGPMHITKYTWRTVESNYDGFWINVRWAFRPSKTYWLMNNYVWPDKGFLRGKTPRNYILFHYRVCKEQWNGCLERKRIRDDIMVKYETELVLRILRLPLQDILYNNTEYVWNMLDWTKHQKNGK